jgi:hypothetical protein
LFYPDKKFLISSHVPVVFFYPFRVLGKLKVYKIDTNVNKICKYLSDNNIFYTKEVVIKFIKLFKSNYTDLEIILESCDKNNFDKSFYFFCKYNKLKLFSNKKAYSK